MSFSVIIADLHINTSKHQKFEENKIEELLKNIHSEIMEVTNIIFAGDTFDRNTPSLRDIKLFYYLVSELSMFTIEIINGNHDFSVFTYLPHKGFTYYDTITKRDGITFVPWTSLNDLVVTKEKKGLCISHARCTIQPHIAEEYPIRNFATTFHTTILGDIHSPISPYSNVTYCSSPFTTHYKIKHKCSHGYILLNNNTYEIRRRWLTGPCKVRLRSDIDKLATKVSSCTDQDNLYKIIVEDYAEKLKGINKYPKNNVIVEPLVKIVDKEVSDRILAILSQAKTIEDIVFSYVKENYNYYEESIALEIINRIKGN